MAKHQHSQGERDKLQAESGQKKTWQPVHDQLKAVEDGGNDLTFLQSQDDHAALLTDAGSDEEQSNIIKQLQQSYGNSYVQRLLSSGTVQAKLTVNSPGDAYEKEADNIADMVIRTLTPGIQRQAEEEIQMMPLLQREADKGDEALIRTEADERQNIPVPESIENRIDASRGSGQSLPDPVRASLEPKFGNDFRQVRVHTDVEADNLSQEIGAKAFTTRQDIFFRSNEYNPESPAGLKLLVHELMHTLQQGASSRIAGWWPLGHRTITAKVLALEDLKDAYDEGARKYLVDRSPDFDFIQDETNAMEKGMAESEPKIKELKKIVKKKKKAKPDEKTKAINMWDKNELHQRPQWYMLHHGEGGFYREGAAEGAGKNSLVTVTLLKLAAELYNGGKREAGLSILSDALHQAEDRGSHQEGEKFKGHDIRQTIKKKYIPEGVKEIPPANYYKKKPYPDNAEKNREGAVNALLYAQETLQRFLQMVQDLPITRETLEEQPSTGKRQTKVKVGHGLGKLTASSGKKKTKWPGRTGAKTIKAIKPEEWMEKTQVEVTSAEDIQLLTNTISNYIIEWLTSELMELIRENDSPSERVKITIYKFEELKKEYPELMKYVAYEDEMVICKRALENYEYQRATRYSSKKEGAEVLED